MLGTGLRSSAISSGDFPRRGRRREHRPLPAPVRPAAQRRRSARRAVITAKPAGEAMHRARSQVRASERVYLSVPYAERQTRRSASARAGIRTPGAGTSPKARRSLPFERWRRKNDRPLLRVPEDPRQEFGEALRRAGLLIDGLPEMDGKLRRVRVDGDRRGAKSGAYAGFLDRPPGRLYREFQDRREGKLEGIRDRSAAHRPGSRAATSEKPRSGGRSGRIAPKPSTPRRSAC